MVAGSAVALTASLAPAAFVSAGAPSGVETGGAVFVVGLGAGVGVAAGVGVGVAAGLTSDCAALPLLPPDC